PGCCRVVSTRARLVQVVGGAPRCLTGPVGDSGGEASLAGGAAVGRVGPTPCTVISVGLVALAAMVKVPLALE
ncbi:MAG: hypothetical protein ACREQ5_25255, partial [Candidatus Dormibacteria bacterium]